MLKAQSFELCVLSSELSTLCSELRALSSGVGTQNLGPCVLNSELRSLGFEFRSVSSELTGGAFTISQRCAGLARGGGGGMGVAYIETARAGAGRALVALICYALGRQLW